MLEWFSLAEGLSKLSSLTLSSPYKKEEQVKNDEQEMRKLNNAGCLTRVSWRDNQAQEMRKLREEVEILRV